MIELCLNTGDWGLGIGQSPIPNPQSPIINNYTINMNLTNDINYNQKLPLCY